MREAYHCSSMQYNPRIPPLVIFHNILATLGYSSSLLARFLFSCRVVNQSSYAEWLSFARFLISRIREDARITRKKMNGESARVNLVLRICIWDREGLLQWRVVEESGTCFTVRVVLKGASMFNTSAKWSRFAREDSPLMRCDKSNG